MAQQQSELGHTLCVKRREFLGIQDSVTESETLDPYWKVELHSNHSRHIVIHYEALASDRRLSTPEI